jgi:hypothetical protein
MATRSDFLLALVCPPLYLWSRRRWVGIVLVGLVWLRGVTLTGAGLLEIAQGNRDEGLLFVLGLGLLFWLASVLVFLAGAENESIESELEQGPPVSTALP